MGFLIAILIIGIIIVNLPRILSWLMAYALKRKIRRAFGDAFDGKRTPEGNGPAAPVRHKKIDPSQGEYVRFEEVQVHTSETTSSVTDDVDGTRRQTVVTEEQIVDAEWEEIG